MARIKTFKDLKVWRKAHTLTVKIYKITDDFPKQEMFGLASRIRREAISVASNIVKGFSRRTIKDSNNFYNISLSSLEEVKYQLLLSYDLSMIKTNEYNQAINLCEEAGKMLYKWQSCCRNKIT